MGDDPLLQRFGREFPSGAVLFREGDQGREMYVVHSGRVAISKRVGERETTLSTLGPGEFLGEMAILCGRPRSATATVVEDATLLVLDSHTFEAMIHASAEIAVRMIRKLAERLQAADDQISGLLLRDETGRILRGLAAAAERAARGPGPVRLPQALRDLPVQEGVAAAQVDAVVQKLARAHLVALDAGAVVVPDPGRLRQFVEFLQLRAQAHAGESS